MEKHIRFWGGTKYMLARNFIKRIPILGIMIKRVYQVFYKDIFPGSANYWETRYSNGGNSGQGSYGRLALFKAEIINRFVVDHNIKSVVEFGCGDGNQLSLSKYPFYVGLDISTKAIEICKKKFRKDTSKCFFEYNTGLNKELNSELSLSLDVIYHLIEDSIFEHYMRDLFNSSERYVIIYSSNMDTDSGVKHVKHRVFTQYIEENIPNWKLLKKINNKYPIKGESSEESFADFYIYQYDRECTRERPQIMLS